MFASSFLLSFYGRAMVLGRLCTLNEEIGGISSREQRGPCEEKRRIERGGIRTGSLVLLCFAASSHVPIARIIHTVKDIDVRLCTTMELEQRDAEAEALCHGMTERLKLLHEERAILSTELRELSARGRASSSGRLLAADNAVAAMATAGLAGILAGVAAARFLAARKTSRLKRGGGADRTKRFDQPPPKAASS